jgi:hypothetical protein
MPKFKVQIKQRQGQSTKSKEFRLFPICLFIAGKDFVIWYSIDICLPAGQAGALTIEL